MPPLQKIQHIVMVPNEYDETGDLNQKIIMNMAKNSLI